MRLWRPVVLIALLLVACSSGREHAHSAAPSAAPPAVSPPLFTDLGTHHHPVSCTPQAQAYFDQGLRLVYGFNHDEAMRAFDEAARLDPNCAMAYWGVALALGPNINLPIDAERAKAAHDALQRAVALAPKASPAEQAYIAALSQALFGRSERRPQGARPRLRRRDARAGAGVPGRSRRGDAVRRGADGPAPVGSLDARRPAAPRDAGDRRDARRRSCEAPEPPRRQPLLHPRRRGVAAPGEGTAERATGWRTLVPGAGHLVHMPSHIYMRTGRYADAAEANRQAIAVDERYIAAAQPAGVYPMMYYPHNIHFLWAAATMEGRSAEALQAARQVAAKVPPEMARADADARVLHADAVLRPGALRPLGRDARRAGAARRSALQRRHVALRARARLRRHRATADAEREEAALKSLAAQHPARPHRRRQSARRAASAPRGALARRRDRRAPGTLRGGAAEARGGRQRAGQPAVHGAAAVVLSRCARCSARCCCSAVGPRRPRRCSARISSATPTTAGRCTGLAQSLRAQKEPGAAEADAQFRQAWRDADVKLTAARF